MTIIPVDTENLAVDLQKIDEPRVMVIGDVMLDKYSWCEATRISPEAPVPVALLKNVTYAPGGCGNVAANVSSLGGTAEIYTVIGDDFYGSTLVHSLKEHDVNCDHVVRASGRITTVKNRILAHNQQMLRLDHESSIGLSPAEEERLLAEIKYRISQVDVCVISDYAKGTVSPRVAQTAIQLSNSQGLPVIVDPKGRMYDKYRGATVITPNTTELGQALNRDPSEDDNDICEMAKQLHELLDVNIVLITRGSKGMTLFEDGGEISHIPAMARQVFDVTGAGDTVVAMMALSLASRLDPKNAAVFTNLAAGISVGKIGTSTVTLAELWDSLPVARKVI